MKQIEWFGFLLGKDPSRWTTDWQTSASNLFGNAERVSIPLDWWVHVGGPLRRMFDRAADTWLASDGARKLVLEASLVPDAVINHEIDQWLADRGEALKAVVVDRIDAARGGNDAGEPIDSMVWARRLFGDVLEAEPTLEPMIESFLWDEKKSRQGISSPPWTYWSKFVTWLVRRGFDERAIFALDSRLTFLRVALSPQDERGEYSSLTPDQIMVNPTFDVIKRPKASEGAPLIAFCRTSDGDKVLVRTHLLTASEAMVLDEVKENFRMECRRLIASLVRYMPETACIEAIESLSESGFLLWSQIEN